MSDPRYPIGKFQPEPNQTAAQRAEWIQDVAELPARLASMVHGLTAEQLDTPYREGGWTVRQVVHHLADSHMHSYARFRFALTENTPVIKPYEESAWAELLDARTAPPELSLALLDALHGRWVILLNSFSDEDWHKAFRHPEMGDVPLVKALNLYSWHGRHHVAQITSLGERMGWPQG